MVSPTVMQLAIPSPWELGSESESPSDSLLALGLPESPSGLELVCSESPSVLELVYSESPSLSELVSVSVQGNRH